MIPSGPSSRGVGRCAETRPIHQPMVFLMDEPGFTVGLDIIDPRDTRSLICDFVEMVQGIIRTQLGPGVGPTYRP